MKVETKQYYIRLIERKVKTLKRKKNNFISYDQDLINSYIYIFDLLRKHFEEGTSLYEVLETAKSYNIDLTTDKVIPKPLRLYISDWKNNNKNMCLFEFV